MEAVSSHFLLLPVFSFQLPDFLTQVKEALGLPPVAPVVSVAPAFSATPAPPVAGPSSAPAPAPALLAASAPPPIILEDEDESEDVQTLAVPCRAGSSDAFLPMVSTDDSWSTDAEFRFVILFIALFAGHNISFHLRNEPFLDVLNEPL